MKINLFTSLCIFALYSIGNASAMATQSHEHSNGAAHHGQAAGSNEEMLSTRKVLTKDDHTGDLKRSIPVMKLRHHGNHGDENQGKTKPCEHHIVCPANHTCDINNHHCSTNNSLEGYHTCSISTECGGASYPWGATLIPNHEFIVPVYTFPYLNLSNYLAPPLLDVSLAGFFCRLERPPQISSK